MLVLGAITISSLAVWGIGGAATLVGGLLALWKGPKLLKPENETAKIVTAKGLNPFRRSEKIIAKDGPKFFWGWSASKSSDIPLETYKVPVERKGKTEALVLKDFVKAEVFAEFYVCVDSSTPASMARALEALGGKIDQQKIAEFCMAKFDGALRAAASGMEIEDVQSNREAFRDAVKKALDTLQQDGLRLVDISLRQLNQSPIGDFEPTNLLDAQGLKKVTKIVEESKKIVNDTRQENRVLIAERDKEAENKTLLIDEQKKKATLEQGERVKQLEAEQGRRVAEFEAEQSKQAEMARLQAAQETEARRIEKKKEVALAEEKRQESVAVAQTQREAASRQAEIAKLKALELAEQDKKVALHKKGQEEAAAAQLANEARAKAVAAEQSVVTAKEVAEAERLKQVEVLTAQKDAEKVAAGQRINADAQVYVAEKNAEAAKTEAKGRSEALTISAEAEVSAAKKRAEASYQAEYQPLKAAADGKAAEAEAEKKLNEARNALSDEARKLILDLERTRITPQALEVMVAAIANIDSLNVTSINGMTPVSGGGGAGGGDPGVGSSRGTLFEQFFDAANNNALNKTLMRKLIASVGGDTSIADNLPDFGMPSNSNAPAAPKPAAEATPVAAPAVTTGGAVRAPKPPSP